MNISTKTKIKDLEKRIKHLEFISNIQSLPLEKRTDVFINQLLQDLEQLKIK